MSGKSEDEQDVIRDNMGFLFRDMTDEENKIVEELSANLYRLEDVLGGSHE